MTMQPAIAQARLAKLTKKRFPAADHITYSRDEADYVTLWDVRDASGMALWDSMSPDVKHSDWPTLKQAVTLLHTAAEESGQRGDGLRMAVA